MYMRPFGQRGTRLVAALLLAVVMALGAALIGTDDVEADSVLPLQAGLNEIVYSGETAPITQALANIDGLFTAVYQWHGPSQSWRVFRPGQPAFLSDLTTMETNGIYWIAVSSSTELTIAEPAPAADLPGIGDPWRRSDDIQLTPTACTALPGFVWSCDVTVTNRGSATVDLTLPSDHWQWQNSEGVFFDVFYTFQSAGVEQASCFASAGADLRCTSVSMTNLAPAAGRDITVVFVHGAGQLGSPTIRLIASGSTFNDGTTWALPLG